MIVSQALWHTAAVWATWKPKEENQLNQWVQDQPGPHTETPSPNNQPKRIFEILENNLHIFFKVPETFLGSLVYKLLKGQKDGSANEGFYFQAQQAEQHP